MSSSGSPGSSKLEDETVVFGQVDLEEHGGFFFFVVDTAIGFSSSISC